jgi:cyclopropane-fatty-acyl-phospholipid synthase
MSTDYRGASSSAIRHHYDVGTEFYALWLDPTLTYSCALWDGADDTLPDAQVRKLDYLAGEAGAIGAASVLDIGCGWGALLTRLVQVHGVGRAVGLTLSAEQATYVSALADDRCDVRIENWVDHRPAAPYDAIVSIGAFEHFARYGMSRADRISAYRRFFESCHAWLPSGGRLALQTNVRGNKGVPMINSLVPILVVVHVIWTDGSNRRRSGSEATGAAGALGRTATSPAVGR